MSAATPAPIWWCEIHKRQSLFCPLPSSACRRVQKRLVDPSALVIERDADGKWKLPQDTDRDRWHHGLIASVLDDLAAAARREAST